MKLAADTGRSLHAGALYFAFVFGIGFVLGTMRVLVVAPKVGDLVAVLIEVPILLSLAWIICGRVLVKTGVPHSLGPHVIVGASAFILLMSAEFMLSIWAFGNSLDAHLQAYQTAAGTVGLGGQLMFALFPAIQLLNEPKLV